MSSGACMKSAVIALTFLPAALLAQEALPSGSHIHGTGHLSIIISEGAFTLMLQVPGADVVGFEEAAETDADRERVAAAVSDLSKPLELFALPTEAGCAAVSANVALVGEGLRPQTDTAEESHTEFQADYVVQCDDINAATVMEFPYFERFEMAQRLTVKMATSTDERTFEVSREMPVLNLLDAQ